MIRMEFQGLVIVAAGATLVGMLLAALVYVLLTRDDDAGLRLRDPVAAGCGPPQFIQTTSLREISKPKVDVSYDPLSDAPDTEPDKRETGRRDRLKMVVADTQSRAAQVTSAAARPMIPGLPPQAAPHDKQRQTRLLALIRETQSRA
jgi:hypothetical protein